MLSDDQDNYEDVDYDEERPPDPPFWWHFFAIMEMLTEGIAEAFSVASEYVEAAFYFLLDRLTLLFMPWRWFRNPEDEETAQPDEVDPTLEKVNEFRIEYVEAAFYFLLDRLTLLFMPWRWFRNPEDEETAQPDEVNPTLEKLNEFRLTLLGAYFVATGILREAFDLVLEHLANAFRRYFPRQIFWPLYWVLDTVIAFYDFSMEWWYSRDFRRIWLLAPAVVLGLGLGGVTVFAFVLNESGKVGHYEKQLEQAKLDGDEPRTLLLERKLQQLGFERLDEVQFRTAMDLQKKGDYAAAVGLVKELAPLEQPGYALAHLWLANELISGKFAIPEEEMVKEFETHVAYASMLAPEHELTQRFQIELQVRTGPMNDELLSKIETLSRKQPDLHTALAHEYLLQGRTADAKRSARSAIRDFESSRRRPFSGGTKDIETKSYEDLTAVGYLRLAECYKIVGNSDAELELLSRAAERFPNDPGVTSVFLARCVDVFKTLELTDEKVLSLASSILRQDPDNKEVTLRLVRGLAAQSIAPQATNSEKVANACNDVAIELQNEGLLPLEVYVFAGDYHLLKKNTSKAIEFYTRACKMDPSASFAWNNLASIWSTSEPLQLGNALKAANRAIGLNPDPNFYDTRGQIFVKLQRWEDAINDLEFALSGSIPNLADAHRSLATCYDALGKPEQAQAHKEILATIE